MVDAPVGTISTNKRSQPNVTAGGHAALVKAGGEDDADDKVYLVSLLKIIHPVPHI